MPAGQRHAQIEAGHPHLSVGATRNPTNDSIILDVVADRNAVRITGSRTEVRLLVQMIASAVDLDIDMSQP